VAGDRLPLPKCVYINTDFPGNDLDCDDVKDRNRNDPDDVRCRGGVNAGSARYSKAGSPAGAKRVILANMEHG
jgi:hypothetical protein